MKRCTKCGAEKEETEFGIDKKNRDGLKNRCKTCVNEYQRMVWNDPNHPAHAGRVRWSRIGFKLISRRKKEPEHSYTWARRELDWRRRKVECLPGCLANEGYLCRSHYQALWDYQGGRCGLCGGLLARGMKPYPAADHQHRDPDGRGPVRGLLHGGKSGCNVRILGAFEAGRKVPDEALEIACRAYLDNPPSARMVGSSWSRTPQPVPKYSGSEV